MPGNGIGCYSCSSEMSGPLRHPLASTSFVFGMVAVCTVDLGCSESSSSPTATSASTGVGASGSDAVGATGGPGSTGSAGTSGGTGGASGGSPPGDGSTGPLPPVDLHLVVDQFGYRTGSEKIAVIRNPKSGFDASSSFLPGATYSLVNVATGARVYSTAPSAWNGGAVDGSSGDQAWWFDFSRVADPGDYYVLDVDKNVRSAVFSISDGVYRDVLKQAVRTFFYQRVGQAKDAKDAGAEWADGASHLGPLQDHHARLYSDQSNAATEKDLWGGWYDAGDYNKYTSWTAAYVLRLLRAYAENPTAWGDDYGIPESGNGVADVVDEARWGIDFLARMQESDGSVLSIVGEAGASPPSAATGPSLYGSANTSATLSTAAAFAYASKVLRSLGKPELVANADALLNQAKRAWVWADAHPAVIFKNNDAASGSQGLGAGQQETDDYGRLTMKLNAAAHLFEVTGDPAYRTFFDASFTMTHMLQNGGFVYPFEAETQETLLDYTRMAGATAAVADAIRAAYRNGIDGNDNLKAFRSNADPYLGYLKDYTWGSNAIKSNQGSVFYDVITYGLDPALNAEAERAAERYLHYLHGVNPFAMVYLSNMYAHGAENSVNEFYHTWFADKSPLWDRVGTSQHGPPPGFLTGGPNPSYDWDACCPTNCGSPANNAICNSEPLSPPKGQPPQKAYKDFNTNWPIDSWQVTENSDGYQVAYIRLLSKFVK